MKNTAFWIIALLSFSPSANAGELSLIINGKAIHPKMVPILFFQIKVGLF